MRYWTHALVTIVAGAVIGAGSAGAQESVYTRHLEARPIPTESPPRSPVRLATAEEAVPIAERGAPLRLMPRSESSSRGIDRPAAPTVNGAIGTVAGSLAIVIGLFLVLAWCSRKFAPAGSTQLPKEALELLGRSSLGPRQQVQLVRIGNKLLLVAITAAGAETLTEITDAEEVERLAALCRRGQAASATSSFTQVMTQLAREPAAGGFAGQSRRATRGAA
ncbi:MAG TPA: flagellar biosynthetic protein FliO [Pirellulaceae bacterium]|nr:flagellar biosynthetic protein FliO [Pirellulaceae bacterium]